MAEDVHDLAEVLPRDDLEFLHPDAKGLGEVGVHPPLVIFPAILGLDQPQREFPQPWEKESSSFVGPAGAK